MLGSIRKASRSWLAIIVVGILVVSFALWGVQDVFLSDNNPTLISVNDYDVQEPEYLLELQLAYLQGRQQYGSDYTMRVALDFGLGSQVAEQIVNGAVMRQVVEEVGVRTSDRQLSQQVRQNPNFTGPSGRFDERTFNEFLRYFSMTPDIYFRFMRDDLSRTQLLSAVASGAGAPEGLAGMLYAYAQEQRALEFFVLPPVAVETPEDPGDDVLQAYYDNNLASYRLPEYRTLTVLSLSTAEIADTIEVPEEDIVNMYEIRRDMFETPEQRTIEQLTFSSVEAAEAALTAIENGTPFEDAGGNFVDLGSISQQEAIDPLLAEAAFALEEPGLTGIVEGTLAVSIARVIDITPASEVPLEEAHDQIRDELATRAASEELFELSQNLEDRRAAGDPLEDIGAALRLPVFTVDSVDSSGESPDGASYDDLLAIEGALSQGFSLPEGAESTLQETSDGDFYVVRVDHITPDRQPGLSEIRDSVLTDWRAAEVSRQLGEMAQAAAERINGGADFDEVASELGRIVRSPETPLRRTQTSEVFSRSTLAQLFTLPLRDVVAAEQRTGSGWVVARATRVIAAEPNNDDIATVHEELSTRLQTEIAEVYMDHARSEADVFINDRALQNTLNNIQR